MAWFVLLLLFTVFCESLTNEIFVEQFVENAVPVHHFLRGLDYLSGHKHQARYTRQVAPPMDLDQAYSYFEGAMAYDSESLCFPRTFCEVMVISRKGYTGPQSHFQAAVEAFMAHHLQPGPKLRPTPWAAKVLLRGGFLGMKYEDPRYCQLKYRTCHMSSKKLWNLLGSELPQ